MSKAANAVLALSRAFYGKRLSEKQYSDLLACKSMNELASYLRTRTVYSDAFSDVHTTDFSSGSLEDIVMKHIANGFDSICRFELAIGNEFYKYFIVQNEIEQILKCTLFIIGGNTEGYLMQLSNFLSNHLSIDLYSLGKANTLEDIAAAIANTPYEKIYRRCLAAEERSYLAFEIAFDNYFELFQSKLVERCFKGSEKKAMYEMICRDYDRSFIQNQHRIVKYYSGSLDVTNLIAPSDISLTLLNERQVRQIIDCTNEQDFNQILQKTPYKDCVGDRIEDKLYLKFYNYCKKKIRFSSYPAVVMYSYLFLARVETANIVRIIEGIKYDIPIDEIKSTLVGIGD